MASPIDELADAPPPDGVNGGGGIWRDFGIRIAEAAAKHAIHWKPEEGEAFRERILNTLAGLNGTASAPDVRRGGDDIAAALAGHHHTTQPAVLAAKQKTEEIVAMISRGLRSLTDQYDLAQEIDALHTAAKAGSAADWEGKKARIQELIDQLGVKESQRSIRCDDLVREFHGLLEKSDLSLPIASPRALAGSEPPAIITQLDSLTGFPMGQSARDSIIEMQAADTPPYLAVIHIQSLDVLNARFGHRIGDQIVLTCCQHLATNLCHATDRLFRWRGPAFVALLERDDSPAGVSREINSVCSSISSSFFGEPNRTILIPVKMASTTIAIGSRLPNEIFDAIERFIVRSGRPTP